MSAVPPATCAAHVYPTLAALSIIIHDALIEIGMIDAEGNVLEDPR